MKSAAANGNGAVQLMRAAEDRGLLVIDPLAAVATVVDRREVRRRLESIDSATNGLVRWAEAIEVAGRGNEEHKQVPRMCVALQQCDALICKPCVACGVHQSHDMRLVWDPRSLPPSVRPLNLSFTERNSCDEHRLHLSPPMPACY